MVHGSRRGYMLAEMMVSLTVLTIGLLGILVLYAQSLRVNRVIANDYVATYLAAEGIEVVKSLIDGNIIRGEADPLGCHLPNGDGTVAHDTSLPTGPCNQNALGNAAGNGPVICFNSSFQYVHGAPCPANQRTPYRRVINLQKVGGATAQGIRVRSTVTWTAASGDRSVVLEDYFAKWRP